jgi:hypothetical protein
MKHIYKILLVIALVPAVFGISCRASKVVAELNWLPDVIETQTQVAGYLDAGYSPELKEQLTKNLSKVKKSDDD